MIPVRVEAGKSINFVVPKSPSNSISEFRLHFCRYGGNLLSYLDGHAAVPLFLLYGTLYERSDQWVYDILEC